jgi:uncharacterized membrane protein
LGLLVAPVAACAAAGPFLLLLAVFRANVYAARQQLRIGGHRVPSLVPRALIQIVFLAACGAGIGGAPE